MKKRMLMAGLAAAAIAAPAITQATPLSPEAALSAALGTQALKARAASAAPGYQLKLTISKPLQAQEAAVYVFGGEKGGYIVAAADDAVAPLLGYSDSGAFDPANIPAPMQWWLNEYASQIAYATANGAAEVDAAMPAAAPAGRTSISRMCKTKWDQGDPGGNDATEPYNNLCPSFGSMRAVTGCVPTAMAQVMKFHQWPEKGVGSVSYRSGYSDYGKVNINVDFSAHTYDWANMTNTYNMFSSQEEIQAVAQLMADCGAASYVDYSPTGSGTAGENAGKAWINHFNYDKGIRWENHYFYTEDEWSQLIYDELSAGRPVFFGGDDGEIGHAFVCDGYNATSGFFAINWGWGGYCDGYFALNVMKPSGQGTGGGSGQIGYIYNQSVMIGVQKPVGSEVIDANFSLYNINNRGQVQPADLATDSKTYSRSQFVNVGFKQQTVISFGLADMNTADIGFICVDKDGKIVYTHRIYQKEAEIWEGFNFAPQVTSTDFPVGEYDVYAAYRSKGATDWKPMRNYAGYTNRVHLVVTETDINVNDNYFDAPIQDTPAEPQASLKAVRTGVTHVNGTAGDNPTSLYAGCDYEFTFSITADGAFNGEVYTLIANAADEVCAYTKKNMSFAQAGTQDLSATLSFVDVEPGSYKLWVGSYDAATDTPSEAGSWAVTINEGIVVESVISATEPAVLTTAEEAATNLVPGTAYLLAINATNAGPAATHKLGAALLAPDGDGYSIVGTFAADPYEFAADETRELKLRLRIGKATEPGDYVAAIMADKGGDKPEVVSAVSVKVGTDDTAIDTIGVAAGDNARAEYFTIQGTRVDNPSAAGIYLRRQGSKATKIVVK